MTDLQSRLEAAEAGSRELDAEIAVAFGYERDGDEFWRNGECYSIREPDYYDLAGQNRELPHFTTSIDAALGLVPDGYRGDIALREDGRAGARFWHVTDDVPSLTGKAYPTPALAICIAAPKARGE